MSWQSTLSIRDRLPLLTTSSSIFSQSLSTRFTAAWPAGDSRSYWQRSWSGHASECRNARRCFPTYLRGGEYGDDYRRRKWRWLCRPVRAAAPWWARWCRDVNRQPHRLCGRPEDDQELHLRGCVVACVDISIDGGDVQRRVAVLVCGVDVRPRRRESSDFGGIATPGSFV